MTRKEIGIGVSGTGLGACLLRINGVPSSRLRVRTLHDPDPQRRHQRYDAGKGTRASAAAASDRAATRDATVVGAAS